ncbi:RlpA-like double-psi beta-barrel-protein domain-containing protein-containing protein [Trametes maxima]|nr:RlpA-like double-psi beta-barrel-protein domain-containing protein-containing protein [Trametes maxima]
MFFSKTVVVLSVALSALASPHVARHVNHRDIAHRAAMPIPEPEPVLAAPVRKRASNGRCKARSSSAAPSSTAIVPPLNVESTPATSAAPETSAAPTTKAEATTQAQPTTHEQPTTQAAPTTTPKPATTHHTTAAAPATTSQASSSGNEPSFMTGTQTGQGTYYATGLGSCGITNSDTDYIAAVSHLLYDSFPGYNGANPNNNPVCNRKVKATYQGKSVTVAITDRCTGCAITDLDFSPSAFNQLADFSVGRISGMTWVWV